MFRYFIPCRYKTLECKLIFDFIFSRAKKLFFLLENLFNKMETKSFLDDYPKLIIEWHYEKNTELELYPEKLSKGSGKKVWWICEENKVHEWEEKITHRTKRNYNCPFCSNHRISPDFSNSLWHKFPNLRDEWHEEKNGDMKLRLPHAKAKVWWRCKKRHEWEATIDKRANGRNCPCCSNKKLCNDNSLWYQYPELRDEWIEEKNGDMKKFQSGSPKKVWWKCKNNPNHIYEINISCRTKQKTNCPFCCNKKISSDFSNSLWNKHPELRDEWDEKKNGSMKLYAPSSGKKVGWICSKNKNHKWDAVIGSRSHLKSGCPCCNQSHLEIELEKICKEQKIEFIPQKRYDIRYLPYDGEIMYKNNKIRVELQGHQHFQSDNYYHKKSEFPIQEYIKRLNIDNKKSYTTYQSSHSFLSISYLCADNLSVILSQYLSDLEKYDILLRYYITPYIYIQYAETNGIGIADTEICYELSDEENIIYRIYLHNIESLQNPIELSEENFTECCNQLYFDDSIHLHQLLEHSEYSEEE